jgi:hypothetical protein
MCKIVASSSRKCQRNIVEPARLPVMKWLIGIALVASACGGSTTAPSTPPPPVSTTTTTIPPVVIQTILVSACPSSVVGFGMGFFHEFACDTFDRPGVQQPTRRWTKAPSIYLRTVDDAGAAIDQNTLDSTERAIADTLPPPSHGARILGSDNRVGLPSCGRRTPAKPSAGSQILRWTAVNSGCSIVVEVAAAAQVARRSRRGQ